jgi:two-component system response regulator VicR
MSDKTLESRTVLVVEDKKNIRELICLHLEAEGLRCVAAADGPDALALQAQQRFDLIVLDLMLPGMDGIDVCRAVRAGGPNFDAPILMLTARREESQKVLGLDSGADDYLTKPFGIRELIARVRALLRRNEMVSARVGLTGAAGQERLAVGRLDIDPLTGTAAVDGRPVALTVYEFHLLYVLLSQPGTVFSREALLARVWKEQTFVTVRSVDTLVKRLRRKVEDDPANPTLILTMRGAGYKAAHA